MASALRKTALLEAAHRSHWELANADSDSEVWARPELCISNKFQSDADADGSLENTLPHRHLPNPH